MSSVSHDEVRRLIARSLIEGLHDADRTTFEDHLAACAECADLLDNVRAGLRAISLEEVRADAPLVATVQRRLRAWAEAGATRQAPTPWGLIASAAVSLLTTTIGIAGLCAVWRLLAAGHRGSLPVALVVIISLWLLPGFVAAVVAVGLRSERVAAV